MKKEIVVGKIKRLISVIMLLTMLVMLTSCEHWMTKKAYKTEEFLFYNNTIIELREKALEQESLVIPKYLNGQEVYGIRDLRSYISGQRNININCDFYNLKTLYLNEFMGEEQYSQYNNFCLFNLNSCYFVNVPVDLKNFDKAFNYITPGFNNLYLSVGLPNTKIVFFPLKRINMILDEVDFDSEQTYSREYKVVTEAEKKRINTIKKETNEVLGYIQAANLSFMYNYEGSPNYDYCFIDNTEDGKVNKPKYDPIREGYKFTGWYKDSECKEKFNFEEMIEVDIENYKENKIYAGWEEIV